jgi:EAL domain-containing protein (putative c-di-GMP-specific phosphodiesterase class I)
MKLLVWVFSISALVAAGVFAFALSRYDLALIVAVACLAAAQITSAIAARHPGEVDDARLTRLAQRISKSTADIENMSRKQRDQAQRLAELAQDKERGQRRPQSAQPQPRQQRQQSVRPLAADVRPKTSAPASQPAPQHHLYLEPVVRLAEGKTAYYKASFQLPAQLPGGKARAVVSADLRNSGGRWGQWPSALDTALLEQVLPLLARLRTRRAATGVFCPISIATLEDSNALQAYVGILQTNPEAAAGIVLDIHHTSLAGLSEAGMRGLAWLASLGATFCLTGDGLENNDLPALAELGFAFLDVPAAGLMQATQSDHTSPAAQLIHAAQTNNITLIASGASDANDAGYLMNISSLGRGPGFAGPRAVREQATGISTTVQVA